MASEKMISELKTTCNYGNADESSKFYDVKDITGTNLFDYRLTKIKCQLKSKDSIYGIQFYYRNKNNGNELVLIDVKSKETNLIEQEMTFGLEEIVYLRTWISDDDSKLIGFEITTNRGKIQKIGYGDERQLRVLPDLRGKIIVGFGVAADDRNGVTSLYAYYLNKRTYSYIVYSGIFSLRIKAKDEKYKKKCEENLPNMNEENKFWFKICCLPDNQFYDIMKYALNKKI